MARRRFLAAFALAGAVGMAAVYGLGLNSSPIRSDGVGYYLYLPALLIHHDLGLHAVAEASFGGEIPAWTGASLWPETQRYLIKYPIGEALLLLPFFLVGCLLASGVGAPVDGFSWPFQLLAAASSLSYALLGTSLLWRTMERWFDSRTIALAMVGIIFGTNLFHYASYDGIFSHVYSFFLFAAFLRASERLHEQRWLPGLAALGLVGGLIVVTRPTNGLWLIFAAYGLRSRRELARTLEAWLREPAARRALVAGGLAFSGVLGLQVLYWQSVTGHGYVDTYGGEDLELLDPHLFDVLFSVRKGLLFWSPLWLAVLPGLWWLARRAPALLAPAAVYLPLHLWVVASWDTWWYGGSFGMRPFVEATPVLALALAALLDGTRQHPRWRAAVLAFVGLCVALSSWLMLKYWTGVVPFDGATLDSLAADFWKLRR